VGEVTISSKTDLNPRYLLFGVGLSSAEIACRYVLDSDRVHGHLRMSLVGERRHVAWVGFLEMLGTAYYIQAKLSQVFNSHFP
jgi:hypothetical protein